MVRTRVAVVSSKKPKSHGQPSPTQSSNFTIKTLHSSKIKKKRNFKKTVKKPIKKSLFVHHDKPGFIGSLEKTRKPHRFRPGTKAKREIVAQQKSCDMLLNHTQVDRLVRNICSEMNYDVRLSHNTISTICEGAQGLLIDIMTKSRRLAEHAGRQTVQPVDMIALFSIDNSFSDYAHRDKDGGGDTLSKRSLESSSSKVKWSDILLKDNKRERKDKTSSKNVNISTQSSSILVHRELSPIHSTSIPIPPSTTPIMDETENAKELTIDKTVSVASPSPSPSSSSSSSSSRSQSPSRTQQNKEDHSKDHSSIIGNLLSNISEEVMDSNVSMDDDDDNASQMPDKNEIPKILVPPSSPMRNEKVLENNLDSKSTNNNDDDGGNQHHHHHHHRKDPSKKESIKNNNNKTLTIPKRKST
jgi:histone H3